MREKEGGKRPLVGNLLEEAVNSQPGLPDVWLPLFLHLKFAFS